MLPVIGGGTPIPGVIGDGVTDNATVANTFKTAQRPFGAPSFPTVVTLTLGSPGTVNWTNHALRVGDPVVFSTTGALPTGVTAGVPVFVAYAGLTANSFQVIATDPFAAFIAGGSPAASVNFTGSQSGTQTAVVFGLDWDIFILPPGAYHSSGYLGLNGSQRKFRLLAYGAEADNWTATTFGLGYGYGGYSWTSQAICAPILSVPAGSDSVTLANVADASKFWIGGWICLCALDNQSSFGNVRSWPPNTHYFEFLQVSGINTSTGVITFGNPGSPPGNYYQYSTFLRNSYLSSYPIFIPNVPGTVNGVSTGAALAIPMCPDWDTEIEVYGLHSTHQDQISGSARSIKWVDCVFDGQGANPAISKTTIYENCKWNVGIEIDKLIEYVLFKNCTAYAIENQSTSADRLVIDGCIVQILSGTVKNTHIKDSDVQQMTVGPLSFGASESLLIENSRIGSVQASNRIDGQTGQLAEFNNLVNNYTFSGGTLQQPMVSTAANNWAVPGRKLYVNDMANNFANMGMPFEVLNVYQTSVATSAVTISIASPAVITWNSHDLTAGTVVGFETSGALPTGLLPYTPYYVLAAGLTTNTFELSATPGGAAINTTGTQSGTQTGLASPTFNIDTTLSALPVGNSTNSTVSISVANPAVVSWTAHGLTAGTPICFQTTGALPTGISTTVLYYVIASGLLTNSFEFSTSVGGAAVVTTGSQSGTQTCIANPLKFTPHPCPRVTARNITGCAQAVDLSNTPEGLPLFSYAKRQYVGKIDTNQSYLVGTEPYVWGNLVSLSLNVIRADTGSAGSLTATITAKAFNSSLIESDLSEVLDLKTAGLRVITPAAVTGSSGADNLVAFGNWISGGISVAYSAGQNDSTLAQSPIFELIVQTDQGTFTTSKVIMFGGLNNSHTGALADTTWPSDGGFIN